MKNDVNVPSKSNKLNFFQSLRLQTKRAGSGSGSRSVGQSYGSGSVPICDGSGKLIFVFFMGFVLAEFVTIPGTVVRRAVDPYPASTY